MKAMVLLTLSALVLAPATARAQNTPESSATLRGLPGVSIHVEPPVAALADHGITTDVLSTQVEHHLRDGGVPVLNPDSKPTVPGQPTLVVTVTPIYDEYADQCIYAIRVELIQTVHLARIHDPDAPTVLATTWSTGGIGVESKGWRDALIEDVGAFVDTFVDAFAASNGTSTSSAGRP